MTEKHTPGPWAVIPEAHVLRVGGCELGQQVWSPSVRVAFTERQNVGAEVECANARLIAAAPDLLEALKEINIFFGSTAGACEADAEAAIERCRAAIAKAEGRS